MSGPKPAVLNFEELSLTEFGGIETADLKKLAQYLRERYQAVCVDEILPYLIVWCKEKVPSYSERPSMVAGLLVVWRVQGEDRSPDLIDPGDMGQCADDENGWLWLEDAVKADLKPPAMPEAETPLRILEKHFEEEVAISYINYSIVVELKKMAVEQHKERLCSLPHLIGEIDVGLSYHNGAILRPDVKDTANVENSFDPTKMMSQVNDTLISVGI